MEKKLDFSLWRRYVVMSVVWTRLNSNTNFLNRLMFWTNFAAVFPSKVRKPGFHCKEHLFSRKRMKVRHSKIMANSALPDAEMILINTALRLWNRLEFWYSYTLFIRTFLKNVEAEKINQNFKNVVKPFFRLRLLRVQMPASFLTFLRVHAVYSRIDLPAEREGGGLRGGLPFPCRHL